MCSVMNKINIGLTLYEAAPKALASGMSTSKASVYGVKTKQESEKERKITYFSDVVGMESTARKGQE